MVNYYMIPRKSKALSINFEKAGIVMKKKSLALAALAAACVTSFAFATPQTQWTQGEWQLDLGAWNPKASVDTNNITYVNLGDVSTDNKWNF